MPLAPSDQPDSTPEATVVQEKAVDMIMQDRAMASRLLQEHQLLQAIFEHSPMAEAVHASDGRLVAWNALYERFQPDGIQPVATPPHQVDGVPHEHDYGENGVYRLHDYTLPGDMIARFAVPIDKDRDREATLVRARDEAEAKVEAKADLLVNMSHEIRTPLNGLLGMARLLSESGLSKGQQMYADVVMRSGEALLAITNDILDLSKLESGRMELVQTSFDIAECIEETATLFAACADDKGVDLIVRVDPILPRRLIGDESRLRQVVANLLGNAVKFTDKGHIFLDVDAEMVVRDDGRRVARLDCRVADTGRGIPADLCGAVFDRFAQVDEEAEHNHKGTGLGLAVVKALITEMGGDIGVESVEGEGTTFHFTIELSVDAAEVMRRASQGAQGKRVLIVDAETARRDTVAETVRAWGFQVAPCSSAREAFALLDAIEDRGQAIDTILLGERIAEGDATKFTGTLKDRSGLRPPVVLMARLAALSLCDADEEEGVTMVATLPRPVQSSPLMESLEAAVQISPYAVTRPEKVEPPQSSVDAETVAAPIAEENDAQVAPQSDDAPPPAPTSTLDILVAEDNRINQMLIEEILRETGYSYRIVGDGREAVDAWRSDRPRMILMDVSMPDMSGDEATMRIRAEEEGRTRVPIIAVTAHALRGDRERCMKAGMDDHLTKPVTIDAIRQMVDSHLRPEDVREAG